MSRDAFALFLNSRVAVGCAERTIIWYRYMTVRYQNWLAETDHTFDTVGLLDLQDFVVAMRGRYSPSTASQITTVVKTFYHWCIEVKLLVENPALNLRKPKVPDTIPRVAARSYVQHMLEKIKYITWMDRRDSLIIRTLFCTGIRIAECAALRVADVNLENRQLSIIGKGSKLRIQPYPEQLSHPLWQWINLHRPPLDVPWLFFSATSRGGVRGAITIQGIRDVLRRRAEDAALDWIPPHGYRHGFAVDMLRNGASTKLVQALLGHASIETTERYLKLSPDLVQEMFDEKWKELV